MIPSQWLFVACVCHLCVHEKFQSFFECVLVKNRTYDLVSHLRPRLALELLFYLITTYPIQPAAVRPTEVPYFEEHPRFSIRVIRSSH